MDLAIGSVIGGYRIDAVAGRGGMGVVYRATQLALQRTVALKVIAPEFARDDGFRERFKRESLVAASIDHPNVITIHDAREEQGLLFLTMRYVEGTDLRATIAREGRLEPRRAARIVAAVASALDAAHAKGLVHRDVKPANILLAQNRGGEHVYLTDFGLTKHASSKSGVTKTGMFVGTLDYVAPEQLRGGDVDARTDVYSLGCVLYQALTGTVPYPRDSDVAKMFAHASEPPPSLGSSAFDPIVARAMAKDPAARFGSAGELGHAAVAAAESPATEVDVPVEPRPTVLDVPQAESPTDFARTDLAAAPSAPARPRGRRTPALIGGALAALAAIAAVIVILASGGSDKPKAIGDRSLVLQQYGAAVRYAKRNLPVKDRNPTFYDCYSSRSGEPVGSSFDCRFGVSDDTGSLSTDAVLTLHVTSIDPPRFAPIAPDDCYIDDHVGPKKPCS